MIILFGPSGRIGGPKTGCRAPKTLKDALVEGPGSKLLLASLEDQIVDEMKANSDGYATQIGFTLPVNKSDDALRTRENIRKLQAI